MAVLSPTSSLNFTLDALALGFVTPEEVGLKLPASDLAEFKRARQSRRERELTELTRSGFRLSALHRRPTLELTTRGPQQIKAARLPALNLQHSDRDDDDAVNEAVTVAGLPVRIVGPGTGEIAEILSSPEGEVRRCLTDVMIASNALEDDARLGCDNMTDERIIKLLHLVNDILAALEKMEEPAKILAGKINATLTAQITQYVGAAQRQITHALMHLNLDYELAADPSQEDELTKLILDMDRHLDTLKTHQGIQLRNWYSTLQKLFLHPILEKLSYSRRPVSISKPIWASYRNCLEATTQFKKTLMGGHQSGPSGAHMQLEPHTLSPLLTDLGQILEQMTTVLQFLSEMPETPKNTQDKADFLIALRFLFTQSLQHDIPHFLAHFNQEFLLTESVDAKTGLAAVIKVQEGLTQLSTSGLFNGTSQEEQLEPWCAKIVTDLVQPVYLRLFGAQNGSYVRDLGEA